VHPRCLPPWLFTVSSRSVEMMDYRFHCLEMMNLLTVLYYHIVFALFSSSLSSVLLRTVVEVFCIAYGTGETSLRHFQMPWITSPSSQVQFQARRW
jgi:hypothetical protein